MENLLEQSYYLCLKRDGTPFSNRKRIDCKLLPDKATAETMKTSLISEYSYAPDSLVICSSEELHALVNLPENRNVDFCESPIA